MNTGALAATALDWRAEDLWLALQANVPGVSIEVLPEVGSTNTALLDRIRHGDHSPALLVAERQVAGRGRHGRPWSAAAGASLTVSVGLTMTPADWSGLSLAVGLALAEALHPRIGLKWPNDLWLRDADRKLGGILIETVSSGTGADAHARPVVIGIGLNIAAQPPDADAGGAAPVYGSGYAGLAELIPGMTAPEALHRIALPLWRALQAYERDGLGPLLAAWSSRDVLAGRPVQAGVVQGRADGIAADGSLRILSADGTFATVHSGEVSVRPQGPRGSTALEAAR
ncbi:biotin--[acetyl-CoA-carboxylase] ligase [Sphaerotilus mobilis]|uniref:biotin--[biotin carboxyl-carrier protein] ligase n=1 Tax=Sphaerotilus mobilis TaxID=47994 RepID=A0A4Q7LJE5_9BURK|nr:biotin--[acetyl-CoA-carboxylase] ligase [Sphaerotilus mobilis]RZS54424.1 BirA family biotin operon repressor/biotin-[acetyl-CoA-carboxylase] ligase [Sphaerotilus mobilis]